MSFAVEFESVREGKKREEKYKKRDKNKNKLNKE